MGFLSRDAILAAQDIETETVDVPEWGGSVQVRGLTGGQRDAYQQSLVGSAKGKSVAVNMQHATARLVAWCVIDEAGARMFKDADVVALSQKSGAALQRVFEVATRLSGLDEGAVEEMAANLSAIPGGDSSST